MHYRRNADTQLRSALRQFEAGQVPPDYVARILERTGTAIEILKSRQPNVFLRGSPVKCEVLLLEFVWD